ncbi:hypothetical protein [Thiocystis violacea]|uniref:hypothetical protein n=1 Tax=Thiocystis violacea TaxID=13725 RepID=UPI00190670A6|nr:hypothetical protein [Thiocystis violacea]
MKTMKNPHNDANDAIKKGRRSEAFKSTPALVASPAETRTASHSSQKCRIEDRKKSGIKNITIKLFSEKLVPFSMLKKEIGNNTDKKIAAAQRISDLLFI